MLTGFVPVAQAISAARQAFAGEDIGYESPSEAAKRYDWMTLAAFLDAAQPGATARAVLEAAYVTEYGIPLEAQSALNLIMMMSDENLARSAGGDAWALFGDSDERWKIQGGNQAISETLAARHRERVRLGWALEAIAERPGGGWRLAFSDGREVLADVVVCTIPFSVLRRLDLAGVDLPATKKKAIAELGYGNNAKLLMPFSARVWEAQGDDGSVYTDLELQDLWAPEPWVRPAAAC
ncbi:MAG: FAD-dependent oxidoreductase [Myxococcota bacterium]